MAAAGKAKMSDLWYRHRDSKMINEEAMDPLLCPDSSLPVIFFFYHSVTIEVKDLQV